MHVAAGGPGGARVPRPAPGHVGGVHRVPDAAHRAERTRGVPRDRAGPHPGGCPPTWAAASATRGSCSPRRCSSAGSRCGAGIRCVGSRTGASSSPGTRTAASTTTSSPATRRRTGASSGSSARPTSTRAPIPPTRSRPDWSPPRWGASSPDPTSSRDTTAAPGRWRPTSRPSCPTGESHGPGSASRSRCSSMRWPASSESIRSSSG